MKFLIITIFCTAMVANAFAQMCINEINQARRNNGKPNIAHHQQVQDAAYDHNAHMVRNNCFSHQCPGEPSLGDRLTNRGYRWRGVGEIIAAGASQCSGSVDQWLNSAGHRAILLGDNIHVGCSGLLCSNCQYPTYYTCVFASPM